MRERSTLTVTLTEESRHGAGTGASGRTFGQRRRNRHGRGFRGEMIPSHLPGARTRSERFDGWVMESTQRLERLWGERIQDLQIVVQEIPDGLEAMTGQHLHGVLGRATAAADKIPPTIIIYRHPVEMAAKGIAALNELVHDVVVEQTAELLGMTPEAVDPAYGRSGT